MGDLGRYWAQSDGCPPTVRLGGLCPPAPPVPPPMALMYVHCRLQHWVICSSSLCETWHDADSVSIDRADLLRSNGYSVVQRARSRRLEASMGVNHGGVAIAAVAGVRLTAVNAGVIPSTFAYVAARVTTGQSSCLVVVVYRPGSSAVTANFFIELADVLD